MKTVHFYFIASLLGMNILIGQVAFSQTPSSPPANNVQDDNRVSNPVSDKPFAEERMAAQNFIENINEARKELTIKQPDLAQQKILMARNLLPIISRVTPAQRRLTRVEFGGGLYANDLDQRKTYSPIETQSLESLTRSAGPRWVKNTRAESDAKIIYIALDLTGNAAQAYLDQAKKEIIAGNIKAAEVQLEELSDQVIKVDDTVPPATQAHDYLCLAGNYILVNNFFGARNSLGQANDFLDKMTNDEIYKSHHTDIIALHKNIEDLQTAFAKLDADQIKNAGVNLKKWVQQLASWSAK